MRAATARIASTSFLDQLAQLVRVERPAAERLGRAGDAVDGRHDRHVELDAYVRPQKILGDQRRLAVAPHLEAQRLHVHAPDLVEVRDRDRAAVHDDLAPADAGPDQARLAGRALVEPCEQRHDDGQDDDNHDCPRDDVGHSASSIS
ncbi:MAG: hypothetical protein M5U08_20565 [Burkholderiales bacterium]|nr:hypothetical protein [Burkholderiales bacterium]